MCTKRTSIRSLSQRGLTLIELIIFIVIVSAALAGVLTVLNITTQHSADPMIRKQMLAIAEALLEEVQMKPFTFCDLTDANASTSTHPSLGTSGTGSISGTTMTITAILRTGFAVGMKLTGGVMITALVTGTGGTGTYTVSPSTTLSSQQITDTAYCATTIENIGPEAGETRSSATTPFNNVNDYAGLSLASPIPDITATSTAPEGYSATIAVANDASFGVSASPLTSSEVLRITVTVSHGSDSLAIESYRTRYSPNF